MVKTRQMIFLGVAMAVMGASTLAGAQVIDRIVAIVNNEIITLSQLRKATQPYRTSIEASQESKAQKEEQLGRLESDMLQQLVDKSLTIQEAKKYGIQVRDEDVDRAIENFKKTNRLDDIRLERGLAAEGLTLADYRERIKEQLLQSMLVNRAVRSKVIITDDDIQAYYDANKDQFTGIRKYRLRNILTQKEADIKKVESLLKNKGAFAELAKKYSIGSNASDGGELGVFDINSFSQDIHDALQGLKKGQFSPVIQTGGAYQIIYVEDIIMEGSQTLEEARVKIQNILYSEQGQKQFKEWMESLKKNAHIKLML